MIYSYRETKSLDCRKLTPVSFHRNGITEKHIEDLLASNPSLLFSNADGVILIARQRAGARRPDLMFLDGARNLYIVEIKRGSADRAALGQIQEYGAQVAGWAREDFEAEWKRLKRKTPLSQAFKTSFHVGLTEPIARRIKLVLVARSLEPGIPDLLDWLRDNGTNIRYVPFAFYRLSRQRFLEMTPIPLGPLVSSVSTNWYLNTNGTYRPKSYLKMFRRGVAAIANFGAKRGQQMLAEPQPGARVFAYANRHGYIWAGRFGEGPPRSSGSVFGVQDRDELHRDVGWYLSVPLKDAVSAQWVRAQGFTCPGRGSTLMRMSDPGAADIIETELRRRANHAK